MLTWVCKQSVKSIRTSSFMSYILLHSENLFDILLIWSNRVQGGSLPYEHRPWACIEVVSMTTYEAISLMIAFGMFIIALLAYIDRNNKRK